MNNELEELKPIDGLEVHVINPQDNPNMMKFGGPVGITPEIRTEIEQQLLEFGKQAKNFFDGFKKALRKFYPGSNRDWHFKLCYRTIKKGPRKGNRVYFAIKVKDMDHE